MNKIFKSFTFYLGIFGFIVTLVLINIISREIPRSPPIRNPAENPYPHSIAASGIIEASDRNIAIGIPSSGIVTAVYVVVNDHVKEGDSLFQIDPRELEAQNGELKARLAVAIAQKKRVESQLSKLKSIEDRRAVSQEDLDTKENDVNVAAAEVLSAKASLKKNELLLERMTVHAPKSGIILQSNIRKGEYAEANSPTPAMILGDIEVLQVRVDIDEQNASQYKLGLPAIAYLKNNPSFKIPLKFTRIEPFVIPKKSLTGASDERVDTRVLQVIYAIDQEDQSRLLVGQQVDVFIELGDKS